MFLASRNMCSHPVAFSAPDMPRPATRQAFSETFGRILVRCSKVRRGCNFCKGTCFTAFAGRQEAAIHRCSGGIIRFAFVFISCSVAPPFSLSPYFFCLVHRISSVHRPALCRSYLAPPSHTLVLSFAYILPQEILFLHQ